MPEAAAGGIDQCAALKLLPLSPAGSSASGAKHPRGQRAGILLHALLERSAAQRNEGNQPATPGRRLVAAAGFPTPSWRVRPIAERLRAAPPLRRFFDPNCYQRAWNEMEITDHGGAVLRLDRLVGTLKTYWVLDYRVQAAIRQGSTTIATGGYRLLPGCGGDFRRQTVRGALVLLTHRW